MPWFVAWLKDGEVVPNGQGEPHFPAFDGNKFVRAVREKLCWVCGQRLGTYRIFVAGPMCGITRTTSEPPCHYDCAVWSVRGCPWLSRPKMGRVDEAATQAHAAGMAIMRNPGVILLWPARKYDVVRLAAGGPGNEGYLLRMGDPVKPLVFYREGRRASRVEIIESIEGGLPALTEIARKQGDGAEGELGGLLQVFMKLLPPS